MANKGSTASGEVVVYDLSSLTFRRRGTTMSVLSATGEEIARRECGQDPDRQAAADVLEHAAGNAVVWRQGRPCAVAFYHPETTQVSLGAWPNGSVLGAGGPVHLEAAGSVAVRDGGSLVLGDGSVLAPQPTLDMAALARLLAR